MDYKSFFTNFIYSGMYEYNDLVYKIDKLYVEGKLSESDRDELVSLAADHADNASQINMYEYVVGLEHRIAALESAGIPEWKSGYATQKGEVVKYDYNNDGILDLLRYDGGRSSTTLSPGKIDGWHVVDTLGNILGTYYRGEFTPVS